MDKLVRDKIPDMIRARGEDPTYVECHKKHRLERLTDKLLEETQEFVEGQNIEELADTLEVVHALSLEIGYTPHDLERVRVGKAIARGGFHDGVILQIRSPGYEARKDKV